MVWGVSLATLAGFVGIVWLVSLLVPSLTRALLPDDGHRLEALDGFRGLLAISVLLHHGIVFRNAALGRPLGPLDLFLGRGAVAFFFMASAALFVGRLLATDGRLPFRHFYAGRLRRIVPLYAATVAGVVVIVLCEAGGLAVPFTALVVDAGRWMLFDFVPRPDLNGVADSARYLGVVWSLRYEWMLYAALPVLALAYRRLGQGWIILAGLALATLVVHLFALFLAGALACRVARAPARYTDPVLTLTALAGVAAALLVVSEFASARAAVLLFPAFALVLRGRSPLVRWLAAAPMRYLGQISYGVYLLHGLVLILLVRHSAIAQRLLTGSTAAFALLMEAVFLAVMVLATITYVAIERPFHRPGLMRSRLGAMWRRLTSTGRPARRPGAPAVTDRLTGRLSGDAR